MITKELIAKMDSLGFVAWHKAKWAGFSRGLAGCITRRLDKEHRIIEVFDSAADCDCSLFYEFLKEHNLE